MADKKVKERELLITSENFPFAVREAYNTLRTNVLYALSPINGKIIAVTSPNAGEGKSTVSVNLAIALAETSARVLLIDCDLRKPTIHKKLNLNNSSGLSKFIGRLRDHGRRIEARNSAKFGRHDVRPHPAESVGAFRKCKHADFFE